MRRFQLAAALCLGLVPAASVAQTVSAALGQDNAQQARDVSECSALAGKQTGSNPSPSSAQAAGGGSRARAAAAGSVIAGAAGNDAGAGAGAGAVPGGADQRYRSRRARLQPSGQGAYDQAWTDCLTGRGYTVK